MICLFVRTNWFVYLTELLRTKLICQIDLFVYRSGNDGRTALHTATKQADLEAVTVLCAHGANAAERDSFGETALHHTPELTVGSLEHFELMTLLARARADVNAKNLHGQTVLHKAAEHVFMGTKSVTILLKLGADVNLSDSRGRTALHICAAQSLDIPLVTRGDYVWTIEALQDAGANPNAQDCEEKTPLHHAANGGIFRHVAALVDCGADLHIRDVGGATALHIAIARGHSELVPLLRCKCCCASNLPFILN
jgi:ankyrin repeat protein